MSIAIGDRLPDSTLVAASPSGTRPVTIAEIFNGARVAFFGVPGAFTPTCSVRHLPGFREHAAELRAKGVDKIVCLSVNDPFVMTAWAKDQNIGDEILMLSDGNGDFTKAIGLQMDGTRFGMGLRSQRYSMLVNDRVVEKLFVEQGGEFAVSSAEHLLANLGPNG